MTLILCEIDLGVKSVREAMADTVAKIVAFARRVWAREMGRQSKVDENLRAKAGQALIDLDKPEKSLAFRSRMEMLRVEYDMFAEDSAQDEVVLQLHKRITDLAETNELARPLLTQMCSESPVSKLFAAILAQAHADGAKAIRVELASDHVTVVFIDDQKTMEAMTVPSTLWHPIAGFATRLAHCGYDALKSRMSNSAPLPPLARVEDLRKDGFHVTLRG